MGVRSMRRLVLHMSLSHLSSMVWRRWIIRSLLLTICLCFLGAWLGSYVRLIGLGYPDGVYGLGIHIDSGSAMLVHQQIGGYGWQVYMTKPGFWGGFSGIAKYHGLGFAFDPNLFDSTDGQGWMLVFPLWLPSTMFCVLFCVAWRKTRTILSRRAFPVEV